MSATAHVTPPPEAAPNLAIRAKPPSPRRLSRKVLLAGSLLAGAIVAFALVNGLSERPDRRAAEQQQVAAAGGPPESIQGASDQYGANDLAGADLQLADPALELTATAELQRPRDPAWANNSSGGAGASAAPPAPDPQVTARTSPILFTRGEADGASDDADEDSLDADVILLTGFSGRLDSEALRNPKIWVPILGESQHLRLDRIFGKIQPDQICPVVPFPTRDPRRGDRIVESHQRILFDEFRVEPRNILYASEYNPFEAYREIFSTIDRYRNALVDLDDCRVFVSPLSSKLLSVSALLACYDHKRQKSGKFDVGIPYVEVAAYGASVGNLEAERVLTSMWLTGEWEKP